MSLHKTNQKGFTIVELLIVIVVIAILAAISIVAYTGIQNRGKASSSQSVASQAAKKAAAYYAVSSTGGYPANVAAFANENESKLEGLSLIDYASGTYNTASTYDSGKTGVYRTLTGGGCVYWWDYSAGTPVQKPIYFGTITTGC